MLCPCTHRRHPVDLFVCLICPSVAVACTTTFCNHITYYPLRVVCVPNRLTYSIWSMAGAFLGFLPPYNGHLIVCSCDLRSRNNVHAQSVLCSRPSIVAVISQLVSPRASANIKESYLSLRRTGGIAERGQGRGG